MTTMLSPYTPLQILTSTTATAREINHLDEALGSTLTATSIGRPLPRLRHSDLCFQARALDLVYRLCLDRLNLRLRHAAQLVSTIIQFHDPMRPAMTLMCQWASRFFGKRAMVSRCEAL